MIAALLRTLWVRTAWSKWFLRRNLHANPGEWRMFEKLMKNWSQRFRCWVMCHVDPVEFCISNGVPAKMLGMAGRLGFRHISHKKHKLPRILTYICVYIYIHIYLLQAWTWQKEVIVANLSQSPPWRLQCYILHCWPQWRASVPHPRRSCKISQWTMMHKHIQGSWHQNRSLGMVLETKVFTWNSVVLFLQREVYLFKGVLTSLWTRVVGLLLA